MSYLTRHFQMRGAIVGNMPDHTNREAMHKKLHKVKLPRKALLTYSKAVMGCAPVRHHLAATMPKGHFSGLRGKNPNGVIVDDIKPVNRDGGQQMGRIHRDGGYTDMKPGNAYGTYDRKTVVKIGGHYRPKRCNQHTKNVVVTGVERRPSGTLIHYTQGEFKASMTLEQWQANISKLQP